MNSNFEVLNLPANPSERGRMLITRDLVEHLGTCPDCGGVDRVLQLANMTMVVCDIHRVKWVIGTDLFSGGEELTYDNEILQVSQYGNAPMVRKIWNPEEFSGLPWETRNTIGVTVLHLTELELSKHAKEHGFFRSSRLEIGGGEISVVLRRKGVGTPESN